MKTIYRFSDPEQPPLDAVGGKAKSLIEATQAWLPVPPGFVLSTAFFETWRQTVLQSDIWKDFIANLKITKVRRAKAKELKSLIAELAWDDLPSPEFDAEVNEFEDDVIFAVRSSSPEEELVDASFAGGYETVLGVTKKGLQEAVQTCFLSMFDERVAIYKVENEISPNNPKMAVIVQQLIQSDEAGVAFSLNPLNNAYDEAMINANFGLGETVTSGTVTPDTYVVQKNYDSEDSPRSQKILERKIANKSHALWFTPKKGMQLLSNLKPEAPALSDQAAREVATLATRVEKHYDCPMNIEWAFCKDELYLLQARPITSYLPLYPEMLTPPGQPKQLYLDYVVATQGFDDLFSVLGLDIFAEFCSVTGEDGGASGKEGAIWYLHGRCLYLVSNMRRALGGRTVSKMFAAIDKPTQEIFNSIEPHIREYLPRKKPKELRGVIQMALGRYWPYLVGTFTTLMNPLHRQEEYLAKVEELFATCDAMLNETYASFSSQVMRSMTGYQRLMPYIGIVFPPMIARWRLRKMFLNPKTQQIAKKEKVKCKDLLDALSTDPPGNPITGMGREMCRLAAFDEILRMESPVEFATRISTRTFSPEFLVAWDEFNSKFGCRGIREIDAGQPRMCEDPMQFFKQLKEINLDDNATIWVEGQYEEAYEKLLDIAAKQGKEKKFQKLAEIQRAMTSHREHCKYVFVYLVNNLRKLALRLGAKFVHQERFEHREQIFDLHLEQIEAAQKDPTLDLHAMIEENLAPRKIMEGVKSWPRVVDSRGKIHRPIHKPVKAPGLLIGEPISSGKVRGRAKVLQTPYEKPLKPGEILVTRSSEPSWTPIFINAAGVVLEIGGPLQHGAIIAREYGLPCVSSVENATQIIEDGDELVIDGSRGKVSIVKLEEAGEKTQ